MSRGWGEFDNDGGLTVGCLIFSVSLGLSRGCGLMPFIVILCGFILLSLHLWWRFNDQMARYFLVALPLSLLGSVGLVVIEVVQTPALVKEIRQNWK